MATFLDRKKALIRLANRLGTDDFSKVSEHDIKLELEAISKERAIKQAVAYKSFDDDIVLWFVFVNTTRNKKELFKFFFVS